MSARRASTDPAPPPKQPAAPRSAGGRGAPAGAGVFLGVEGGATRTTVLLVEAMGRVLADFSLGPSNLKLLSDREVIWRLRDIEKRLPALKAPLAGLCVGLAGTRTDADAERLRRLASRVFPGIPCHATNDLETALAAAPDKPAAAARVLVLSGTGSCCFGRADDGRVAKVGGRGHVIGDRGSACDIGKQALRELVVEADRAGRWPKFGALVLDALALNVPDDLIDWSMRADKSELGRLSIPVFKAAGERDPIARRILARAAEMLAEDALACAARLAEPSARVRFVLNGGVLTKNPPFARQVATLIRKTRPNAVVAPLERPSAWGAIELARTAAAEAAKPPGRSRALGHEPVLAGLEPVFSREVLVDSPTEQRNPRSAALDSMPLPAAVDLMLDEEASVPRSLATERAAIVWTVEQIVRAFKNDGHLFYVGAGTSGRLGVLDASECPPTFRAPREQVQGILAGGQLALWSAVEGAEDDAEAGVEAIAHRAVTKRDVVIGIAASGRTPFVWGALREARKRGAATALVCFNPAVRAALRGVKPALRPDRVIACDLGPEVLTGSTRLKSGTATKQLLNIFTTLAMTRVGKVIGNLMVDLNPSNVKLRDRAVRIVSQLTGATPDQAREALVRSGWVVKRAYERLGPPASAV